MHCLPPAFRPQLAARAQRAGDGKWVASPYRRQLISSDGRSHSVRLAAPARRHRRAHAAPEGILQSGHPPASTAAGAPNSMSNSSVAAAAAAAVERGIAAARTVCSRLPRGLLLVDPAVPRLEGGALEAGREERAPEHRHVLAAHAGSPASTSPEVSVSGADCSTGLQPVPPRRAHRSGPTTQEWGACFWS